MTMFLIITGTLLLVAGVTCGAAAVYGTFRQFGDGPLLPSADRRARRWWAVVRRVLLRRPARVVTGTLDVTLPALEVNMLGRVTGPHVPDDADVDQRITLLLRRLQNLEQEVESNQRTNTDALKTIRSEIEELSGRLDTETSLLETRTKAMVLGSVPLQLLGLFLTAVGTIMVAVPSLFGS